MKRFLTALSILVYLLVLGVVSAKLFFESDFDAFIARVFRSQTATHSVFRIGVSDPLISTDPRANDVGSRMRSLQIFEPLIRHTPTLELESALALSYGALSPTEWEFRLRPNVYFHDGSLVTPQDVKASLELSQVPTSGVADLLSSVTTIAIKDDTIILTTKSTDVLLPHKLASVLIFKQVGKDFIGTGSYQPATDTLDTLVRFDRYWGMTPFYDSLSLASLLTKDAKVQALTNKSVDILINPPADVAWEFDVPGYQLTVRPGLETDMLLMNAQGVTADVSLRKALQRATTPDTLVRFAHGFATVTNQLASPEIFGYDPTIVLQEGNADAAAEFLKGLTLIPEVPLDLPKGLESFGKTLSFQLEKVGIHTIQNYLTGDELNKKIAQAGSSFYFFGWKHDLGDTLPFLSSVIHTRAGTFGEFNGMNYSNPTVDVLIEQALATTDTATRRTLERQVMKIIIDDDAIAIPLFSPDVLYAVRDGIDFVPRIDGVVMGQELR